MLAALASAPDGENRWRGVGALVVEEWNFGRGDAGWRGRGYFEFRGGKK